MDSIIPIENIASKILIIRKQRVMLDRDLAVLYGVETKVLNQAVKRNINRFPLDFMFELSSDELNNWRSHFVTSNSDKMGLRRRPYAFTEHGILMLSSVLRSEKAIEINILIMRVFSKLRNMLASNEALRRKVAELDQKQKKTDDDIQMLMSVVNMLLDPVPPEEPKPKIGFR